MKTAVNMAAMAGASKPRDKAKQGSIANRVLSPNKMKSPDKNIPRKKAERSAILPVNDDTLGNEFAISKLYPESLFSEEELDFLVKQTTELELRISTISEYLNQADWKKSLKPNIIVSLYHSVIMFAMQNEFSLIQIGTLLSLFRFCLSCSAEPSRNSEKTMEDVRSSLLDLTSKSTFTIESFSVLNSMADIDGRIPIFSPTVSRQIIQFLSQTFFQHYKLYHYYFCNQQEDITIKEYRITNEPPEMISMKDAITEEQMQELLLQEKRKNLLQEKENLLLKISQDPLQYLSSEEILILTQETIQSVMTRLQNEIDFMMNSTGVDTSSMSLTSTSSGRKSPEKKSSSPMP